MSVTDKNFKRIVNRIKATEIQLAAEKAEHWLLPIERSGSASRFCFRANTLECPLCRVLKVELLRPLKTIAFATDLALLVTIYG